MTVFNNNTKGQGQGSNPDGSFKYLVEYEDESGQPVVENIAPAKFKIQPNTLDIGNTTSINDDFSLPGVVDKLNNRKYGLPYVFQINQDGTTDGVFYRKIGDFSWTNPLGTGFVPTDEISSVFNPVTGLYEIEQLFQNGFYVSTIKFRYWITEYDGDRTFNNPTGEILNQVFTTDTLGGSNLIEIANENETYFIDNPDGKDSVADKSFANPAGNFGRSVWSSDKPFSMRRMSNDGGLNNLVYIETFSALVELKRVITEDEITNIVIDLPFYSYRRSTNDRGLEVYNGEQSWVNGGIDAGAVPKLNTADSKITKATLSARSLAISSGAVPDPIVNFNIELYEVGFNTTTKIADIIFPIDSLIHPIGGNNSTNQDTFFEGSIDLDINLQENKKYGLKFVRINSNSDISAYRDIQVNLRTEQKPIIIPITM